MLALDKEERVGVIVAGVKIERIIQLGNGATNASQGFRAIGAGGIKNVDRNNLGTVVFSRPDFAGYLERGRVVPIGAAQGRMQNAVRRSMLVSFVRAQGSLMGAAGGGLWERTVKRQPWT